MNHTDDFRIVLLHEDLVSGIRGASVVERLAGQLEMEVGRLDTDIWKFAVLCDPTLSAQAVDLLRQANLIIISAGGNADLPGHIREIIEQALCFRTRRDAAIVALLDRGDSPGNNCELSRLGLYLRDLAVQTGLDFFCNQGRWHLPVAAAYDPTSIDAENVFSRSNPVVPWNS